MHSIAFAAVIWLWEPWGWHCPALFLVSSCVFIPCACSVFIALLAWHCGLNFTSLVVLSVPSPSSQFFLSTELSGSSVTGAWGRPGMGGLWLGCRLARPVRCSSALVMWSQLQPLGFLGTFPPLETWALTFSLSSQVKRPPLLWMHNKSSFSKTMFLKTYACFSIQNKTPQNNALTSGTSWQLG